MILFSFFQWLILLSFSFCQGTVGEVLSNVGAAQDLLNTNTTQIVKTVSTATSHMS